MVLVFNSGAPVSINFLAEVLGVSVIYSVSSGYVLSLLVYYMLGLVYSVMFAVLVLSGSKGEVLGVVGLLYVGPLVVLRAAGWLLV